MVSTTRLETVLAATTALVGFNGLFTKNAFTYASASNADANADAAIEMSTPFEFCTDNPIGWYDSDGKEYDCHWYAMYDYCERYGHLNMFSNHNKTASDACCACGGGVWNSSTLVPSVPGNENENENGSTALTVPPTPSPTITSTIIATAATSYTPSFCGCSSCTSKVFKRDVIGNSTSSDNNNSDSNSDSVYTSVGYSINWVMSNWRFSEREACTLICVDLFPSVCGNECNPEACIPTEETMSPTPSPTAGTTSTTTTTTTTIPTSISTPTSPSMSPSTSTSPSISTLMPTAVPVPKEPTSTSPPTSSFKLLYPNCTVTFPLWIGDGYCNGGEYNTNECGYDGGDCVAFNAEYPYCDVPYPNLIGNTVCNGGVYNTSECKFDGGDCGGSHFFEKYPNCDIPSMFHHKIGNGICDHIGTFPSSSSFNFSTNINTPECAYDGGDCIEANSKFSHCDENLWTFLFNRKCDIETNNAECHYDNGDCDIFNSYSQCWQVLEEYQSSYLKHKLLGPWSVGDGICQEEFDVEKCGFDGGDCLM